jgi:mono/diheme cytochrome c family protein
MAFVLLSLILGVALVWPSRQGRARRCRRALTNVVAAAAVASVGGLQLPPARGAGPGGPGKVDAAAARALFARYCQRCHGPDGRGDRGGVRGLPDFTDPAWQQRRAGAQLAVSILEGKGTGMPAFNGSLNAAQADALVVHLRAFAPRRPGAGADGPSPPGAPASDFQTRFQELQKEFEELQRQLDELSPRQPGPARAPTPGADGPSARGWPAGPAGTLYRRHCQGCHGPDGGGNRDRFDADAIPDFRRRPWHRLRNDAQMAATILDGQGAMPSFRRRLSEADVRGLVTHLRGFAAAPQAVPGPAPRARQRGSPGEVRGSRDAPEGTTARDLAALDPGRSGGPPPPGRAPAGPLFTQKVALTGRDPRSR